MRILNLSLATALVVPLMTSTVELPRSWATIQPDEEINPGITPTNAYTTSAAYYGILLANNQASDKKYFDLVHTQMDILLYPDLDGTIDDLPIGYSFPDPYEATGNDIYRKSAKILKDVLNNFPKTPDGGFYHRFPTYTDQVWLDGIYLVNPFYARWTKLFEPDNSTAWNDVVLQYDLIDDGTTPNASTNRLPVHGFEWSKKQIWANPENGAAPHVWARAVEWYIMALVDVLDYLPASHSGRVRLIGYLQKLSGAIVAAQDERTKGWWLIMTPSYEGRWGNYIETSGSAMFIYGLLKALRLGYIEGDKYLDSALQGYKLLTETLATPSKPDERLNLQWTVQTKVLSSNGTFEYYASMPIFENDLKGVAPFLFSSHECELLKSKTKGDKRSRTLATL